jgi:glutaredoxin-like protein NrdH
VTITDITTKIQARDGVATVLYTKPDCRQCDMTKMLLDREDIHYTAVDVTEDPDALDFIKALGYMAAPVVYTSTETGDVHWSGFQPTKIREHITHRPEAA